MYSTPYAEEDWGAAEEEREAEQRSYNNAKAASPKTATKAAATTKTATKAAAATTTAAAVKTTTATAGIYLLPCFLPALF